MAACSTVTDWVRTNVWQPVDEWVTKQEKECKKRPWWDPRRWLCWLVTHLVLVVVWVVVAVVVAVVTVVCTVVFDVLGILWDLLKFLGHLFLALVTWDKCRLDEAFSDLLDAVLTLVAIIGHVVIRPVIDEVQIYRLRRYVKHQIAQRYFTRPDVVPRLWQAFNVDSGVFGYHVTAAVHRMYVDSQTLTERFGDVPNLFSLHEQGLVNLYELAGFDRDCSVFSAAGWYRPRHQTAVYPFASGGGGFGDPTPPELKREQLDEYIKSHGTAGPHFRIYAISPGNLDTRCDTVVEYGRQLGLLFDIERHEIEVTEEHYLSYSPGVHVPFLIHELRRADKTTQPSQAMMQLCDPAAVAVFGFSDGSLRGWTANLIGTTGCAAGRDLPPDNASGVSFIDDIPDWIRRYVLIHELGHYFGLCHVDGFDRIMVSGKPGQGDILTWAAAPNFLLHGGPRFIYTESQRVWDFIVDNFPPECLAPDGGVIL